MKPLCVVVALLAFAFAAPTPVRAQIGNGNGNDGAVSISVDTQINSYTTLTADIPNGITSIPVADGSLFAAGDVVMLWQTQGDIGVPIGDLNAIDLSSSSVAGFELLEVLMVSGNELATTTPIGQSYSMSGAQAVRVPQYTTNPNR